MGGEAFGGGVMVAVAAGLWLAYLLPTWLRRRQYLATERNAVLLQQTLRILAETAETPREVQVEATARDVAAQSRILREREAAASARLKAEAEAAAAERRQAEAARAAAARAVAARLAADPAAVARGRRRSLRRWRAFASLVLLVSLAIVIAGWVLGAVAGAWTMFALGCGGVAVAFSGLSALAGAGRAVPPVTAAGTPSGRVVAFEPVEWEDAAPASLSWTPRPLPKPLYLSRGSIAATAMASVDAAAELRKAAAQAELAVRAARLDPAVTPITRSRPVAVPGAVSERGPVSAAASAAREDATREDAAGRSRFAAMGVVGETEPGISDLDAVLRRRRAVG
ncbi:hypothetical protein [Luethyella okanaganae]|uniref:Large exoprotein n=1 Tax=Luethyella okanaganae TaxID=69372 RepID=A0ABW1VHY1_9MICO